MAREIANQVIVITGASSGIGWETALALGRERARLVLVARRKERLETLRKEIEMAGAKALCLPLDLIRIEDIRRMIGETVETFGRIDVLINNAAFGFYGTVERTPTPVVDEIFALNFQAPLYASQLAIPVMRAQGNGHIINISSVAGKRGLPLSGIYSATKFALDGLTQSMRLELKDAGIHVSLINPAATRTPFFAHSRIGDVNGEFRPIGHVQPAAIVAAAIVACIRKPAIEVYPYRSSRAVAWFNAIAPSIVDRLMTPYFRERLRAQRNS